MKFMVKLEKDDLMAAISLLMAERGLRICKVSFISNGTVLGDAIRAEADLEEVPKLPKIPGHTRIE